MGEKGDAKFYLFGRWPVGRRLMIILGSVLLVGSLAVMCLLALFGPAVGNTFESISSHAPMELPRAAYATEAAVMKTVEVEKVVEVTTYAYPGAGMGLVSDGAPANTERLLVRQGDIRLQVEDTLAARQSIEAMVSEMAGEGAFVLSASQYGGQEERSPEISISIRVPARRFDEVMTKLAGLARRVIDRSESAQDVTAEYVDLQARLKSLQTARERLEKLMGSAATTKELLEAEQQLTQREAEIESIQGRMKYLESVAALSLINITLTPYLPSQPLESGWQPAETARRAVDSLVDSLQGFVDFVIYFSIATLPWLVVLALVVFIVLRLVIRRKKPSSPPPSA
ncbi:MAG: DUF4349 domain-containing protein [Chloroflexota bacterium]